jgi:uncharacterized protein DUF4082
MKYLNIGLAALLAILSSGGISEGAIIAFDGTSGTESPTNQFGVSVQGLQFSPNIDIEVTALGVYDAHTLGLSANHHVRLWTSSGTELADVTISSGVHSLESGNVFVDISPVSLASGQTYVVSAHYDALEYFVYEVPSDAALSVANNRRWAFGDVFPANSSSTFIRAVGANFKFEAAAPVPEPSTLAIWSLLGLCGIGIAWRRGKA